MTEAAHVDRQVRIRLMCSFPFRHSRNEHEHERHDLEPVLQCV